MNYTFYHNNEDFEYLNYNNNAEVIEDVRKDFPDTIKEQDCYLIRNDTGEVIWRN